MTVFNKFKIGVTAYLVAVVAIASGDALASPELSPRDLVKSLLAQNDQIRAKQLTKRIAGSEIEKSRAKFDLQFSASAARNVQNEPNTTEEAVTRGGGIYKRNAGDYSASISKLLATGAKFEVSSVASSFMTNAIQALDPGQPDNRRVFYGLSLTQPLMRDGGVDVNNASVKWAELEADAAQSDERDASNAVVAQGLMLFYDLQLAQQQERIEIEKASMALRLLKVAKAAEQGGRASRSEIWEVENALSRFEVSALVAKQNRAEQHNRLKTMLMIDSDMPWSEPKSVFLPVAQSNTLPREVLLQLALENRSDYKRQQLILQRTQSQLDYAKNQREPRLDLIVNYGQTGLAYSWRSAASLDATGQTPKWSVGIQFKTPLGSNREGDAAYEQARARVEEAVLVLDALKVSIGIDVDNSVRLIENVGERWLHWSRVHKREREQLALERERLSNGRSGLRELLFKEERALNAQMSLLEQRVAYAKAQVLQLAAVGTLLNHYAGQ